jgi:hypothetical protein
MSCSQGCKALGRGIHTDFKPQKGRHCVTMSDSVSPLPGLDGELATFFQGLAPPGYTTLPLRGKCPPLFSIL